MKRIVPLIAIILMATVSACSTTTSRTHPDITEQLKTIERVVIAPPEIEVTLVTLTGENERLDDIEASIRAEVVDITKRELVEGGYEVVDFDFETAKQNDDDLAYQLTEFVTAYDNAKEELQHGKSISPEEASSIRASLGEAATRVAAKAGADAVFLVRFGGFQKSEGQIAKDVGTSILVAAITLGAVIPMPPASGAYTEVVLVDGYTGDILWTDIYQGKLSSKITDALLDRLPDDIDAIPTIDVPAVAPDTADEVG